MSRCPTCGGPGGVLLLTSVAPCARCEVGQRDRERRATGLTSRDLGVRQLRAAYVRAVTLWGRELLRIPLPSDFNDATSITGDADHTGSISRIEVVAHDGAVLHHDDFNDLYIEAGQTISYMPRTTEKWWV